MLTASKKAHLENDKINLEKKASRFATDYYYMARSKLKPNCNFFN